MDNNINFMVLTKLLIPLRPNILTEFHFSKNHRKCYFIGEVRIIIFAGAMEVLSYVSKVIKIGNLPMGGNYPVRIQSMTSTNTLDTRATVKQTVKLIESGCEYIRITAQGIKEAENLAAIKKEIRKLGYDNPLIADIHFNPKAAEIAARIVEKVRINPGNYTGRKKGKLHYSEKEYLEELEVIRESVKPLIKICQEYGTAIRIGSNHGSLSERILLRYGNTPAGMVEAALEFVRIFQNLDFHQVVLSMKASNVKVMVQANRLLVKKMIEEGMNYPIHLGVTEAGDGEDGRIKSAAGIGSLLYDNIGDTIRVSLTEDPEFEIPVAKAILCEFNGKIKRKRKEQILPEDVNLFSYHRRITSPIDKIGNGQAPVVIISSQKKGLKSGSGEIDFTPDYIYNLRSNRLQPGKKNILKNSESHNEIAFITIPAGDNAVAEEILPQVDKVIVIKSGKKSSIREIRKSLNFIHSKGFGNPLILMRDYSDWFGDDFLVRVTMEMSLFLTDGLIDGIWIVHSRIPQFEISRIAFGILQATGARISKAEFIACPSCGRTLFNIQDTLKKIKRETLHLKGLKIAVMGCCVNGPGEMADADYGYVGAGKGKITLYKKQQIIQTGIPEEQALYSLKELIKLNGDWK